MNSKCPNCQNTSFEISTENLNKSNHEISFVRCCSCKTIIGCLERESITTLIHKLAQQLGKSLD
jgi:predicted Zn finger-like uncharacterized protein